MERTETLDGGQSFGPQNRIALKTWLLETRPQFLLLTPACVLVGAGASFWDHGTVAPLYLLLAFIGALLGHVSVNVLNDVDDFLSGIDLLTKPTPFSGGSGFLVRGELPASGVRLMGLAALAGTALVGLFFIWKMGWQLIPLGMIGLFLVFFYTSWITRHPWICLVAPGLGFGPAMVMGVDFCQYGSYGLTAMAASIVPGLLVSNLLLLNQFPDIEADAQGGRKHIPLRWGSGKATRLYVLFLLAPFAWVALAVAARLLPWGALMALLTLPLALKAARGVPRSHDDIPNLIPLMGVNVMVTLLTPTLLALGMIAHRLLL